MNPSVYFFHISFHFSISSASHFLSYSFLSFFLSLSLSLSLSFSFSFSLSLLPDCIRYSDVHKISILICTIMWIRRRRRNIIIFSLSSSFFISASLSISISSSICVYIYCLWCIYFHFDFQSFSWRRLSLIFLHLSSSTFYFPVVFCYASILLWSIILICVIRVYLLTIDINKHIFEMCHFSSRTMHL